MLERALSDANEEEHLSAKQLLQRAVVLAVAAEEEERAKEAAMEAVRAENEAAVRAALDTARSSSSISYSSSASIFAELRPRSGTQIAPVRLLRGSWLLARAKAARKALDAVGSGYQSKMDYERRKLRLPRRQELEDAAFLTPEEVEQLEMNEKGALGHEQLAIISVSHCWETAAHPDPRCVTLMAMADAIERAQTRPVRLGDQICMRTLPREVGVFYDWTCLPQQPRSDEEGAAFKSALSRMQIWYAHAMTTTLMMTAPSGLPHVLPYESRGWPSFEQSVSMFNKRGVDPLYWPSLIDARRTRTSNCARHAPPLPSGMRRRLDAKTFTNGADRELVISLYEATARRCILEAEVLSYAGSGWDDAELAVLCGWLRECSATVKLALNNCRLTDVGIATFARTVSGGEGLPDLGSEVADLGGEVADLGGEVADLGSEIAVSGGKETALSALKQLLLHGNSSITSASGDTLATLLQAGALPGLKRLTGDDTLCTCPALVRACTERAIELVKYNFVDNPWEVDAEDARLTAVEPIKASD